MSLRLRKLATQLPYDVLIRIFGMAAHTREGGSPDVACSFRVGDGGDLLPFALV